MKYKGIFLDDRDKDKYFADKLSWNGEPSLSIEFMMVSKGLEDQANNILKAAPDIVLLDYRLTDNPSGEVAIRYKAGPLAQQLRDSVIGPDNTTCDFPVVLLSAEDKKLHGYDPDLTTHDLFDRVYVKEQVVSEIESTQKELIALADGYKKLNGTLNFLDGFYELLGLNEDEKYLTSNQDIRRLIKVSASHQLSRVILKYFILRNGLLLDAYGVIALLGIDPESDTSTLLKFLTDQTTQYSGVFSGGWALWWRHRVEELFARLFNCNPGSISSKERVSKLNALLKSDLKPALSKWVKVETVFPAFACASCGHPTERKHSVAAFDDMPSFVEKKRICWSCVETGTFENIEDLEIADADEYVKQKIENGELKSEV